MIGFSIASEKHVNLYGDADHMTTCKLKGSKQVTVLFCCVESVQTELTVYTFRKILHHLSNIHHICLKHVQELFYTKTFHFICDDFYETFLILLIRKAKPRII